LKIKEEVVKLSEVLECEKEYEEISKLSTDFMKNRNTFNFYDHKPHQAVIAAYILKQSKKVNYVQVDYGHGKTYVILLAAKHIVQETHRKVLILVLNDALVKQMNDSITMLKLPSSMILVQSIINLPAEIPDTVFIDEAYDAFMLSKIKFNKSGIVGGLMGVPIKAKKTILLSGVKCNQMEYLLASLYGQEQFSIKEFGSTNSLIDQDDFNLCTVVCDNDPEDVV
jgi:hypothetical protein